MTTALLELILDFCCIMFNDHRALIKVVVREELIVL